MARIGIITCLNCTQDANCAAVVCLADLRKRRGFFEKYPKDEPLDLVGFISCAGCPTAAAPEKILRRVQAIAEFKVHALHLSYCMTAVCPFVHKYEEVIKEKFPNLEIVLGTHQPAGSLADFRRGVKELLCQTLSPPQTMADMIRGTMKTSE
ncbi:MAG: CGGC domain-containing protein [Thermodesulfobacteriota bacterium]